MKIKICGLTRVEDIAYVNELLPDYIGLVFAKSRRQVSDQQAQYLRSQLNQNIQVVGVFVDDSIAHITQLVNQGVIDIVQLHGHENNNYIKALRLSYDGQIIKAVNIEENRNYAQLYDDCDCYLFDSDQAGSGKSFDWELIQAVKKPYFLAGGLHLGNIDEAMKYNPAVIDISSGVETDGYKDYQKIKEIIRRVRYER